MGERNLKDGSHKIISGRCLQAAVVCSFSRKRTKKGTRHNPNPLFSAGISFKSLKMNGVYEYDIATRAGDVVIVNLLSKR